MGKKKFPEGEGRALIMLGISEQPPVLPSGQRSPFLLQKGSRAHTGEMNKPPRIWELYFLPPPSQPCPGAGYTSCVNMDLNSIYFVLWGREKGEDSKVLCIVWHRKSAWNWKPQFYTIVTTNSFILFQTPSE